MTDVADVARVATVGDEGGNDMVDDGPLQDLAERLAALEAAMASLEIEVRTRRLVVTDDSGVDRIVGTVEHGTAELSLLAGVSALDGRTELVAFAAGGDEALGLESRIGVQLRRRGDEVAELAAWAGEA